MSTVNHQVIIMSYFTMVDMFKEPQDQMQKKWSKNYRNIHQLFNITQTTLLDHNNNRLLD